MRVRVKHPRYTEHIYTVACVEPVGRAHETLQVTLMDGRVRKLDVSQVSWRVEA